MTVYRLPAFLLAATRYSCAARQPCQLPPSLSLTLYDGPNNAPGVLGALGPTAAALAFDTGAATVTVSASGV